MGRALDNAMLNVGLKDVAKGFSSQNPLYLCQVANHLLQLEWRIWDLPLRM